MRLENSCINLPWCLILVQHTFGHLKSPGYPQPSAASSLVHIRPEYSGQNKVIFPIITVAENLVTYWITYGWKRPFWCLDFPWSVAEEKWELLPLWTGRGLHLTRDTNRGLSGWSQSLSVCKAKPGLTIYRTNRNQDQDARKGCA